jgi:transcriptional regulator of arginine metabolism
METDTYLFLVVHKYSSDQLRRREEILGIIRSSEVHSQDELQAALHRRGFEATQPTLSRDLRELGVAKTPNGYAALPLSAGSAAVVSLLTPATREHRLQQALAEYALSAEQAGNLVVIRTAVAGAQPLAVAIDNAGMPEVVGTIAGDDTIFLAVRTSAAAARLVRDLGDHFGPRRQRRARA